MAAGKFHMLEVVGSSPASATKGENAECRRLRLLRSVIKIIIHQKKENNKWESTI